MTDTIAKTLNISADRARLVAGYLRLTYRTLDGLSAAKICSEYYQEISSTIDADPGMADRVASSFGL